MMREFCAVMLRGVIDCSYRLRDAVSLLETTNCGFAPCSLPNKIWDIFGGSFFAVGNRLGMNPDDVQ